MPISKDHRPLIGGGQKRAEALLDAQRGAFRVSAVGAGVAVDSRVMTTTRRSAGPVDGAKSPAATLTTLDAQAVTIDNGLWARRQAVNRDAALPHGFRMLEAAGNLENLRIPAGRSTARYRGPVFMDSDVYK